MIKIRNWDRFQHYKNRSPPWVKLHKSILDNRDWCALGNGPARLLVELWLLASENTPGEISLSKEDLKWRLRKQSASAMLADLQVLVDKGFIECASEMLAERYTEERRGEERQRIIYMGSFEKFWAVYPKRKGANPKKKAQERFRAALKKVDPDELVSIITRFAARMKAEGQAGTEFVPQAQTWLSQERWKDEDDESVPQSGALARPRPWEIGVSP